MLKILTSLELSKQAKSVLVQQYIEKKSSYVFEIISINRLPTFKEIAHMVELAWDKKLTEFINYKIYNDVYYPNEKIKGTQRDIIEMSYLFSFACLTTNHKIKLFFSINHVLADQKAINYFGKVIADYLNDNISYAGSLLKSKAAYLKYIEEQKTSTNNLDIQKINSLNELKVIKVIKGSALSLGGKKRLCFSSEFLSDIDCEKKVRDVYYKIINFLVKENVIEGVLGASSIYLGKGREIAMGMLTGIYYLNEEQTSLSNVPLESYSNQREVKNLIEHINMSDIYFSLSFSRSITSEFIEETQFPIGFYIKKERHKVSFNIEGNFSDYCRTEKLIKTMWSEIL